MRISLDRDALGFRVDVLAARVFLDGELQLHWITADEERGELVRFLVDGAGNPVRHPASRELMRETVRGKVTILW